MPEQQIKFDTPADEFGRPPQQSAGSDITGKLIQWGFVSTRQEAQYALVGVAVVALILAYFLYGKLGGGSSVPTEPVYSANQSI
jgi:hypothetical protein